jgi:Arc/MetJ family transcription regulator
MLKYARRHADYTHETQIGRHNMVKRTSLNLDFALVDEAKEVLETKETTETIHKALREVVRNERLRRLSRRRFDFSNEDLDALRTSRSESAAGVSVHPRPTA